MRREKAAIAIICLSSALVGTARAELAPWTPAVTMVHPSDPGDTARVANGRIKKTDQELTNEQGVVKLFSDGKTGLYVEMRTGKLADGTRPPNNMQAACTPFTLVANADGSVQAQVQPGERFVTNNNGNEDRNANKPQLMPINGGKNMLLMYNYQANGADGKRYVKVLDSACREIPITNQQNQTQTQIVVMAKDNDDCDMHQSGEGACDIASDAAGATHLTCWAGCNGAGDDDGWINDITVTCQNDANGVATTCKVVKNFDASLAQREERSRGRCSVADADPNTSICTWTEGNNQPQRDGVWIAAVDITPGVPTGANAQDRILWKKLIQGRIDLPNDGGRAYAMRINHSRVLEPNAAGQAIRTPNVILSWGVLIGNNTNDRKGGRYVGLNMAVVKADRAGIDYTIPMTDVTTLMLGIDGTHLTMTGVLVQDVDKLVPAMTYLQGSQNGGGATSPDLKVIGIDLVNKKFTDYGTYANGGSYDRHLYSNFLGNNPGNQGRNFAGSTFVPNPFVSASNPAKFMLMHALTGKDPLDVAKPELKPSSYITIMPMLANGPPPAPMPGQNGSGGGMNAGTGGMTGGTGASTEAATPTTATAQPKGFCSATPGPSPHGEDLIFFVVLASAIYIARRRVEA